MLAIPRFHTLTLTATMKIARFAHEQHIFYGIVEGEAVTELAGSPLDTYEITKKRHQLSALKFLVPCIPQNFYCAGVNYAAHVEWAKSRGLNVKVPEKADVGYRSPNALIAHGEPIMIPADSEGPVHFEGELVAIIGKKARNLSEADALSCVAGFTLGNDLSERSWQAQDRTLWRAKNCDSFKPMGPFIVPDLDPMKLTISVRINGKTVSEYETGNMLFSLQHYIFRITHYMTLYPGDVIWLGTDGPTEPALQEGDVVEICNDEIGVLRNPVVRQQ
jgi:2-keto-4-pentenoate hydratase/2-oxohepta-3-ene-1,7-dioic acid hydratase in catechol pathway